MAETSTTRRRKSSMDEVPPDFRLVLVGKTGTGKSSSGNNVLGRESFTADVSHCSVTKQCCKETGEVFGRKVTIVDTPGLFDTSLPESTVRREISKCINMSAPGPHAILLVIKFGPFTSEEQDAVRQVEEIFGEDAWRNTIILFTHGDRVKSDFQSLLEEAGPELQDVLRKAGNRYHLFNNLKMNDREQVLDLLEKAEKMVEDNNGQFYSNVIFQEAMDMMTRREEELRTFYEEKLEEEIKAVTSKYEKKLREAQQEHQQVERRLQTELQEVKRYYAALESDIRHVVEQLMPTDSFNVLQHFNETQKLNVLSC